MSDDIDEPIDLENPPGSAPGEGWRPDIAPEATAQVKSEIPFPVFGSTPAAALTDLPDEFLGWRIYRLASGGAPFPNLNQGQVGSCCSFGTAHALLLTAAAEVVAGDPEGIFVPVMEGIYGVSRVQIGKGAFGRGDGSTGGYCAKAVRDYGVLAQGHYGSYDLAKYDQTRCRAWGRSGMPKDLEGEAAKHKVAEITQINDFDEGCKALAQGYGILIASGVGFSSRRDSEGYAKRSGRWAHCMSVLAYRKGKRPGMFIQNSWGDSFFTGSMPDLDAPRGGFWADADVMNRIFGEDDSWALSGLAGFPMRPLKADKNG